MVSLQWFHNPCKAETSKLSIIHPPKMLLNNLHFIIKHTRILKYSYNHVFLPFSCLSGTSGKYSVPELRIINSRGMRNAAPKVKKDSHLPLSAAWGYSNSLKLHIINGHKPLIQTQGNMLSTMLLKYTSPSPRIVMGAPSPGALTLFPNNK